MVAPKGAAAGSALALALLAALTVAGCSGDSGQGPGSDLPDLHQIPLVGWSTFVSPTASLFSVGLDRVARASGKASVRVSNEQATSLLDQQAGVAQRVPADAYLGRRVRLTARMRADTVAGRGAGVFLSISRPTGTPGLVDDFSNRGAGGSMTRRLPFCGSTLGSWSSSRRRHALPGRRSAMSRWPRMPPGGSITYHRCA